MALAKDLFDNTFQYQELELHFFSDDNDEDDK